MTMPFNVSIVCVPGKVLSSQQVNLNSKTFGLTSLHINTKQYQNCRPLEPFIIPVHQMAFRFPQKHRTCDNAGVIFTETAQVRADQGLYVYTQLDLSTGWSGTHQNKNKISFTTVNVRD